MEDLFHCHGEVQCTLVNLREEPVSFLYMVWRAFGLFSFSIDYLIMVLKVILRMNIQVHVKAILMNFKLQNQAFQI